MGYLSLNLQLQDEPVVVIGGGAVAVRKIAALLPVGAKVTVIAPTLAFDLIALRDKGAITHLARRYQPGDLANAFLVYAATDNREVNRQVAVEARERNILAEITDKPGEGKLISPAVIRQGDLTVAISTNGKAPALAAIIKRELQPLIGQEYAQATQLLGTIREKLLTDRTGSTYNKQVLRDLAGKLPALFASNAFDEIDRLLETSLGAGITLENLESKLRETT